MTDPTKYVRQMYQNALSGVLKVYDGQAPADVRKTTDARQIVYAVINTSWEKEPIKNCEYFRFTVTLELFAEFKEYGSSTPVDDAADKILQIMEPPDSKDNPAIGGGYAVSLTELPAVANTSYRDDAFAIWQKTLILQHLIS